ncbi:tape-measure protein [Streptomyces sp. NPDC002514]|uniref:tape-measure protein n=1 Tax=Streptomyces sp. NPDC001270 TaxID=3364554 RepID=UPI00369D2057
MSTAPGAVPADPIGALLPAVRSLGSRAAQNVTALRSVTGRFKDAVTGINRLASAAAQAAEAVRQTKAHAETAARSVARTARTATTAAGGVKSFKTGAKGAGSKLGILLTGLGGLMSLILSQGDPAGPLGTLLAAFGTAMTIGSGVLLVINALTRASPVGFVTGLLLPVAGWLIDLAVNSETGQRIIDQLATLILQYVQGYLAVLAPILQAIAGAVNTYVTGYLTVITAALTTISALIGTAFAVAKALATGDTHALSGKVSAVWRGLKDAVRPVVDWITQDIPRGFTRIKEATSGTLRAMGQFVTTGAQSVAGVIKGPFQGLVAFANWVIDGLNKLSFSFLGKKFGVHLSKIPMLAQGGIAVPGAAPRTGKVLSLDDLERRRAVARRQRSANASPHRYQVKEFHESHGAGAHATATDLLFLASAHAGA